MKVRFNVNDRGELESRDGQVIGRLTSLTLEVEKSQFAGASGGGIGGGSVVVGEQQERKKENDPLPPDSSSERGDVEVVWDCYVETMKPRSKVLDAETRKLIRDALKVADVAECCGAILGCKASPFHMGDNDRRKRYNRISQILKGKRPSAQGPGRTTREQIDLFLDIAEKAGVGAGMASVDPAKVRTAKREVRDAFEYPGDEVVATRGVEARAWLQDNGWQVVDSDDGPIFNLTQPQ